jgi:hypothetical protein
MKRTILSLSLLVVFALGGFVFQRWTRARALPASAPLDPMTDVAPMIDGEPLKRAQKKEGIPSIDDPEFVPADKAQLKDDALVMSATLNGATHVYSLEFMNAHELVNDEIGGVKVAVTY